MKPENIATTRDLRIALKHWQREFGLQGWDIEAAFVRPSDMDNGEADAEVDWCLDNQSAAVKILRPKFNSKPIEQRLIHELMHVRMPVYTEDPTANQIFEAGIDAIANLIYRMALIIRGLATQ